MCYDFAGSSQKQEQDEVIAEYKAELDQARKDKIIGKADAASRLKTVKDGLLSGSFPPDTVRTATRLLKADRLEILEMREKHGEMQPLPVKSRKRETVNA